MPYRVVNGFVLADVEAQGTQGDKAVATTSEWKTSEGTQGEVKLATGKWFGDEKDDAGIQTSADSKFYGISANFDTFSEQLKEASSTIEVELEDECLCHRCNPNAIPMQSHAESAAQARKRRKKATSERMQTLAHLWRKKPTSERMQKLALLRTACAQI